jgi:hypothetical protein
VALVIVLAAWRLWRMASAMVSCTGFPRPGGHVHGVAGVTSVLLAQRERGGGNGAGLATTWPCTFWSVPVHALSRACTSGRLWASRLLVSAVHENIEASVWHDQERVGKTTDKVGRVGVHQREREHVHVHAMPRHG